MANNYRFSQKINFIKFDQEDRKIGALNSVSYDFKLVWFQGRLTLAINTTFQLK